MQQGTKIRIPWLERDDIPKWDETCAWAIEQFGLPGNKFTTHPTAEYMDFVFVDEVDAIHFSLRWE
jgi:hypothetical protein